MANPWVVLKFGGTSVSGKPRWETIRQVVQERLAAGERPLIVCSAVCGVSDLLERVTQQAVRGTHEPLLDEIALVHRRLAKDLGVDPGVMAGELERLARLATGVSLVAEASPRVAAQIMAIGELCATRLGAAFLQRSGLSCAWLDVRQCLVSSAMPEALPERRYLAAKCDVAADPALAARLEQEPAAVLVTQGFIARNEQGDTVLLGRGGSDTSAAYLAARLGAVRCEIWTDVPGMFTADPRQVPGARLLRMLDYDEAQEIAASGAKVLHPRCIAPVKAHGIAMLVKCTDMPHGPGTEISARAQKGDAQIKAIAARRGITLISMDTVDMWQEPGFLAEAFAHFKRRGLSVDLVSTSQSNVTVSLDQATGVSPDAVRALLADLAPLCQARAIEHCAVVSLVGRNVRATLHELAPALEVFEQQPVYLLSQAANDLNLTLVVDEEPADRLVAEVHGQLFKQRGSEELFGPSWKELVEQFHGMVRPALTPWWRSQQAALLAVARTGTPVYVYDSATIAARIAGLRSLQSVDRVFYSIKANSNAAVLQIVERSGLGFECVSVGEIDHLFGLFPQLMPERVMFTPNFAHRREYAEALRRGVFVTLDNLYPLRQWGDLFAGRSILVRLDPGRGSGHHQYVKTAGARSKFGVAVEQLGELTDLAARHRVEIVGLHAHVGSNIFNAETWMQNATFLANIAERFAAVRYIDVGGGLGVVERPGQQPLALDEVDACLARAKAAHPQLEIWMEPGRFIVAEAGVLLAHTTQTKRKGDYHFIGLDCGMNTLIRPALYGAYHDIVNLTRLDQPADRLANIVGPICESGDILGYERKVAQPQDGDVFLIATAGAYGRTMSSQYNLRPLAEEVVLGG